MNESTSTTPDPDRDQRPQGYGLAILRGMQGKHVYGGTVPDGVKEQRRKENRRARRSRRINRGRR